MIWFTSDLHFNHNNILKYEPISRPFETVEEMNETLIKNWNDRVKPEDTIYVLGDLCMGKDTDIPAILERLTGRIVLIRGNHDQSKRRKIYEKHGIEIRDISYLPYKGRFFVMCHFPIASEEFMEMVRKDNSEVIMLYGHIHSNAPKGYKDGTFHVGVDTNDLRPVSIEEIWQQSWPEEMMTPFVKEYKEKFENGSEHECPV